jgi:hypothetical protein
MDKKLVSSSLVSGSRFSSGGNASLSTFFFVSFLVNFRLGARFAEGEA